MNPKLRLVLVGLVLVVLAGLGGWALIGGGGDEAEPLASPSSEPEATSSPSASPSPTGTPSPTESATTSCEDADTQFNVEGVEQDSLLPDCGTRVVNVRQQEASGLDLGCGGTYPVILYKTTTTDGSKASVCGRNSSGERFRVVVKPAGDDVIDMPGDYDAGNDAFLGEKGSTLYEIVGRNGSIVVSTENGSRTLESDGDWSSLDNEPDGD